jgi:hypothetical protein
VTQPGQFTMRRIYATFWNGANGEEIAALYTSIDTDPGTYSVVEEIPGDHLQLRSTNAATGQVLGHRTVFADRPWVVIDQTSGVIANISEAAYAVRFLRGSEAGALIAGGQEPYFGDGLGMAAATIGIGATVNVDVAVSPPIPTGYLSTAVLRTQILAVTGVNLTTTTLAATPTVVVPFVPTALVGGVIVPAYSLVRSRIKNSGLTLLSTVQIRTTAYRESA